MDMNDKEIKNKHQRKKDQKNYMRGWRLSAK
jgi:hypothetical protein